MIADLDNYLERLDEERYLDAESFDDHYADEINGVAEFEDSNIDS